MMNDEEFYKSHILNSARIERVKFDPNNPEHKLSVKQFMETGKWGNIKFDVEFPYFDVYTTVITKLARHHLGIIN